MKQLLMACLLLTGALFSHYAIAASTNLTYAYDDYNRLQQVVYGDGSYVEYQYDGVGNIVTATFVGDTDGDGVPNAVDNCPDVANPSQSDVNGNGIGDACDSASDSDNDGLSDAAEVLVYHTSPVSPDSDNDGISDGQEVLAGTDPLVANNGSFNPDGDFHSGMLLDLDVAGGGSQMTRRESLNFHGSVVGSYEVVAASSGGIGQTGEVRVLPNPDHTFSVADTDYAGITANDQSVEVLADVVNGADGLALKINGKSGSGMGVGDLNGNYVFSEFRNATVSQAPTMITRRLALNFNGVGGVDYTSLADSSGESSSGSAGYTVFADGSLDLLGGSGFVSPDGEVLVSVDAAVNTDTLDDDIYLGVGVRRGANMRKHSLFGEFVLGEMGYEVNSWTSRSVYTFDGRGHGTFKRTADSDGQITSTPVPFAYDVDTVGNISIDGQPLGVLSANGEFLVFADTDWSDASPGIFMGVGVKSGKRFPDRPGIFRQGNWYLDLSGNGLYDNTDWGTVFGALPGDRPVVGDWNGDGLSEIGVYRPSEGYWYLDYNGNGIWDGVPTDRQLGKLGQPTDIPVVGDWNGDGKSKIGLYRPSEGNWYLDYNGNGVWNGSPVDRQYHLGRPTDMPVFGDWNGDGKAKIGVYRPSEGNWYLDYNGNGVWNGSPVDRQYHLGQPTDMPVFGDWNGDGKAKIGVYRPSEGNWYLDYNGNGIWNGSPIDRQYGKFGQPNDFPVVGKW